MNKKSKIVIAIIVSVIISIFAYYFAGAINALLLKKSIISINTKEIYISMISNLKHLQLFFMLDLLLITIINSALFFNFRENYNSDSDSITPTIKTPKVAGQGQHGTARWLKKEEYKDYYEQYNYNPKNFQEPQKAGLIVNKQTNDDGSEDYYYIAKDLHSVILGATRSGKSRCLVLPSLSLLLKAGENIIVSDPKGELCQYTYPLLEEEGYEVITIDFKTPSKSNNYNFLQPIINAIKNDDIPLAIDLTWDITKALVGEATGEKLWNNGEASVIAGAIMAVIYDNKDKPYNQNFTNVYMFILEMCKTRGKEMYINKYLAKLPYEHPAKSVFGVAEIAPEKTRGSFFTAALSTLILFTNQNIYSMSNKSDFDLLETGDKKRAIFIILPDEKTKFYSLASLFVYQQYVALVENADSKGGRLDRRVNFILDEFGNFTTIPSFGNMLTVGGGRGIRFNLFIQSFSQLEEKYGKDIANNIKDNCHCWIYLKSSDPQTTKVLSDKLGNYTASSFSRSSTSKEINSSASMSLISRALLNPDEIERIERPYTLVMLAGAFPGITKLEDISKWHCNKEFGLGDEAHNTKLRMQRQEGRPSKAVETIKLWRIWDEFDPKYQPPEEEIDDTTQYFEDIVG